MEVGRSCLILSPASSAHALWLGVEGCGRGENRLVVDVGNDWHIRRLGSANHDGWVGGHLLWRKGTKKDKHSSRFTEMRAFSCEDRRDDFAVIHFQALATG